MIKKLTKDLKDKDKEIDRLRAAEQVVLSLSLSSCPTTGGSRACCARRAQHSLRACMSAGQGSADQKDARQTGGEGKGAEGGSAEKA